MRFGLSVFAIWVVGGATLNATSAIHQERSFFGILKVQYEKKYDEEFHKLVHGGPGAALLRPWWRN